MGSTEAHFPAEDVNSILKQTVEATLQGNDYQGSKVDIWTAQCIDTCVKRLASLRVPFKFVVTCIIMQKTGAGLHTATSAFWDGTCDGTRTLRWESKTMYCIMTVFGLSI